MEATEKKYLSVREAAEYIGYSTRYVYRLVALNVLPHYTPNGGRIIFNRVELDEWIARNEMEKQKVEVERDRKEVQRHQAHR